MAKETLMVKNFGPIREANLDLRKVTVLIGEQASGKSVLAKLAAIFRSSRFLSEHSRESLTSDRLGLFISSSLGFYGLFEFLKKNAEIGYSNSDYKVTIQSEDRIVNIEFYNDFLHTYFKQEFNLDQEIRRLEDEETLAFVKKEFEKSAQKQAEKNLLNQRISKTREEIERIVFQVNYLPAERNALAVSSNPKLIYLEDFFKNFQLKRTFKDKPFNLGLINAEYFYDGQSNRDLIRFQNSNPIDLQFAASGIHSFVPIMVTVDTINPLLKHLFIIEEPELNLYPTTQKKLVEYLIEKCTKGDNRLIITTHSPYILTALNNCIQARNTLREHPEHADEVAKLIRPESQIDFEDVMAYFVADGTAKPIMNNENRLIDANALDDVSEELSETFDRLLDLEMQPA